MNRVLMFGLSVGLGVAGATAVVSAQEDVLDNPTVTSDGAFVVATDDQGGENDVEGGGTDIVVGDVTTGNSGGEVLGDPNAVYYPDLSAVPSISGQTHTPTITGLPIGNPSSGNLVPELDLGALVASGALSAPAPTATTTEAAPAPAPPPAATTTEAAPAPAGEPVDDQAGVPIG